MPEDHEQQHDEHVRYEPRIRENPPKDEASFDRYQKEATSTKRLSLKDIPLPLGGLSEQRSFLFRSIEPPALDERISTSIFDFHLPSQVSSNALVGKSIHPETTGSDANESSNVIITGMNVDGNEEGFGSQEVFEL